MLISCESPPCCIFSPLASATQKPIKSPQEHVSKNLHHNDNGHNDDDALQKKFLGPQEHNLVLLITSICKAEALNCCINYMILPKQLNSFRRKIWWQNLHLISASNSVEYARKHSQWIFQMIIFSGQSNLQLLELGQRVNRFSLKRSSIVIQLLFESAAVSQTSSSTGLRGERIKILWR